MRTTLTLDPDVQRLVEETMHRDRTSMKVVVNEALRRALAPAATTRPYVVDVHHSLLAPGIDPSRMNQLVDELDDETRMEDLNR